MHRRPGSSELLLSPAPRPRGRFSAEAATRPALALAALVMLSCGGGAPSDPSPVSAGAPSAVDFGGDAGVSASNASPFLKLKTRPRAVSDDPYPVVTGVAPLTVSFNLCESGDADLATEENPDGDSLNWQFHFGDDDTPAVDEDGTFNPHFEHFCRTEHTYAERGSYVATVSVTDKHLEDQAREVSATARVTERVTVVVVTDEPTGPYTYTGGRNGPINFRSGPERSFGIGGGTAAGWTEDGNYLLSGNPNRFPPLIVCATGLGFPNGQVSRLAVLTATQTAIDSSGLPHYIADASSTIGGVSAAGCRIYVK
jgi:hypothetical protein